MPIGLHFMALFLIIYYEVLSSMEKLPKVLREYFL
jgi:hypothetical protein